MSPSDATRKLRVFSLPCIPSTNFTTTTNMDACRFAYSCPIRGRLPRFAGTIPSSASYTSDSSSKAGLDLRVPSTNFNHDDERGRTDSRIRVPFVDGCHNPIVRELTNVSSPKAGLDPRVPSTNFNHDDERGRTDSRIRVPFVDGCHNPILRELTSVPSPNPGLDRAI
jgi:hypothetical protein